MSIAVGRKKKDKADDNERDITLVTGRGSVLLETTKSLM